MEKFVNSDTVIDVLQAFAQRNHYNVNVHRGILDTKEVFEANVVDVKSLCDIEKTGMKKRVLYDILDSLNETTDEPIFTFIAKNEEGKILGFCIVTKFSIVPSKIYTTIDDFQFSRKHTIFNSFNKLNRISVTEKESPTKEVYVIHKVANLSLLCSHRESGSIYKAVGSVLLLLSIAYAKKIGYDMMYLTIGEPIRVRKDEYESKEALRSVYKLRKQIPKRNDTALKFYSNNGFVSIVPYATHEINKNLGKTVYDKYFASYKIVDGKYIYNAPFFGDYLGTKEFENAIFSQMDGIPTPRQMARLTDINQNTLTPFLKVTPQKPAAKISPIKTPTPHIPRVSPQKPPKTPTPPIREPGISPKPAIREPTPPRKIPTPFKPPTPKISPQRPAVKISPIKTPTPPIYEPGISPRPTIRAPTPPRKIPTPRKPSTPRISPQRPAGKISPIKTPTPPIYEPGISPRKIKIQYHKKKGVRTTKPYIYRVLKMKHPKHSITEKAMNVMKNIIENITNKIITEAYDILHTTKAHILTYRAIQSALKMILAPNANQLTLYKFADLEGQKAINSYSRMMKEKKGGKKRSHAEMAGITFSPRMFGKKIAHYCPKAKINKHASVYLAAVIEYLTTEILELAGNIAKKNVRITPRQILLAIKGDNELSNVFLGTVASGGVAPQHT